MTTFFKIPTHMTIIVLTWLIVVSGCNSDQGEQVMPKPVNFIVLLDLSDRLTVSGTDINDQALILAVARQFESRVKMNLIIRSSDKFKIRIFPQKGYRLDVNMYENMLSIDMKALEIALKNSQLKRFMVDLPATVRQLYLDASLDKTKTSDYFGSDIWKYFNEQLRLDLEKDCKNHIIVLTDGYFDFENSAHAISRGNRHTSSDFYSRLSGPDWMKEANDKDFGIIPVNLEKPFCCCICGLNPKNEQLTEMEKISWFWQKWMRESNADTCFLIPFSSSEKMKGIIQKYIGKEVN